MHLASLGRWHAFGLFVKTLGLLRNGVDRVDPVNPESNELHALNVVPWATSEV